MTARILILLLLAVIISPSSVHADPGAYVIPLEGARWASTVIPVFVFGGDEEQQNQFLQAIKMWNEAQLWFAREYFPNSSVYTFELGGTSAPVQVTLLNSSIVVENIEGWTSYRAENGVIESASVTIAAAHPDHALLVLIAHELGHVLGLGDDPICCKTDLMNAFPIVNNASALPTTLDLYALHILSVAYAIPSTVWLANQIPYQTALSSPKLNGSPGMPLLVPEGYRTRKPSI